MVSNAQMYFQMDNILTYSFKTIEYLLILLVYGYSLVFKNKRSNYCFYVKSQINIFVIGNMKRRAFTLNKSNRVNRSFTYTKVGTLAEENDVRNFNKPRNSEVVAPSMPQRIELPLFFNTPCRRTSSFLNKSTREDKQQEKVENDIYISAMRRLKDYEMLAFGCRRGGKVRDEGRAYYSIGVILDNIKRPKKAIQYYQKFLQVCKGIGDTHGEALAYNCIGVNYQLLAEKGDSKFLSKAIEYHTLHEQLADTNGKFLASINLGLCYQKLQDRKSSVYWFQMALQHSIKMSNLVGQSLAVGSIGRIGAPGLNQNKDKMKVFIQKYLKLSQEMKNVEGEMNATFKLGLLSGSKRNFEQGRQNFLKALKLAEETGQSDMYNSAKFGLAVMNAQKDMTRHLKRFSNHLDNTMYQQQL